MVNNFGLGPFADTASCTLTRSLGCRKACLKREAVFEPWLPATTHELWSEQSTGFVCLPDLARCDIIGRKAAAPKATRVKA